MAEKYLPVSKDVYNAILELNMSLQEVYGDDVTVSDTVDFLGHQFFINKRLLEGARIAIEMMDAETRCKAFKGLAACPSEKRGILEDFLNIFGLQTPEDPTCFIETNIDVPMHWAVTRWVLDVEAKNLVKCLSQPETKKQQSKVYRVDVK